MSQEQLLQEFAEAYEQLIQPGEYVYERTQAVIGHCQEHMQQLVLSHP